MVDEKQIEVDGDEKWLYAAVDTESKVLLEIDVHIRRGSDPVAVFLHRLGEKHDINDMEFLVDAGGYLTALARRELRGQLNYNDRNHIETWFQTVAMRIDRFHSCWGTVNRALAGGYSGSDTIIITIGRIRRSTDAHLLRRSSTRQCREEAPIRNISYINRYYSGPLNDIFAPEE